MNDTIEPHGLDWLYVFDKASGGDGNGTHGQDRFGFNARVEQLLKDNSRSLTCTFYFGSDGTLCATHNGRFSDTMRCDRHPVATKAHRGGLWQGPSPEADPPRVVCTCGPWTVEGDPRFRTSKGTWHKRSCPFHLAPDVERLARTQDVLAQALPAIVAAWDNDQTDNVGVARLILAIVAHEYARLAPFGDRQGSDLADSDSAQCPYAECERPKGHDGDHTHAEAR